MKFKRLSDDKVQIIISSEDLEKRDVKKWDLMPSSPRAQELFQEMLDQAYEECGFEVDSETQLMVEAYPMTTDSLVITLTKVKHRDSFEIDYDEDSEELYDEIDEEEIAELTGEELIYLFKDFEDVVQLAKLLKDDYFDKCSMFKLGQAYYLVFSNPDNLTDHALGMLGEYSALVHLSEAYLLEHGQLMIKNDAIRVLAAM
ncbi:MAG: adaptor protein MecA [Clostridia bacterium]|nr:adaptor protein MecA [Clostridia bacterium]